MLMLSRMTKPQRGPNSVAQKNPDRESSIGPKTWGGAYQVDGACFAPGGYGIPRRYWTWVG